MRRSRWSRTLVVLVVLVSMLALGGAGPSPVGAEQPIFERPLKPYRGPRFAPGELLVRFKPSAEPEELEGLNRKLGVSVIRVGRHRAFLRLRAPAGAKLGELIKAYEEQDIVEYAERNYVAYALGTPNDPLYSYQWHLDNAVYGGIQMEEAWGIQTGESSVIVAVIDTGVAYENYGRGRSKYYLAPDLADTVFVAGYDFVENDTHPNDDDSHGTHVAGTIAQSTNNEEGVAGVAYNTAIMPVKVLDRNGSGTYADIVNGIMWAADHGAKVINLSLGGPSASETLEAAVKYAYEHGVSVIAAAGNEYEDGNEPLYPAAYDAYVIAVGATRYDEQRAYYSNTGSYVDLTAPGGDLSVDQNDDGYGDGVLQNTFNPNTKRRSDFGYWFFEGTSMAAPHVSGVAALLIAEGVATTPAEVRHVLESTAEDKGSGGWDLKYGWGIVDAHAALTFGATPNEPPVADAGGPYDGTEDDAITFDGSGSYDPDDEPLTYKWDFGDGTKVTVDTPNTTHIYTTGQAGVDKPYTVILVVNDGKVDSDPATTTATVTGVNDLPVADADGPYPGVVGEAITFDASDSSDEEGIDTYTWNFGDGTVETVDTSITIHTYTTKGIYVVTLTVTDGDGATATDITTAEVTEAPAYPAMHIASIDMSLKIAGPNRTAIATVTIFDAVGNPVEGATVYGQWSELTGDSDSGVTDASGEVALSSDRVRNVSGTFTFTVDNVAKDGWTYDSSGDTSNWIAVP